MNRFILIGILGACGLIAYLFTSAFYTVSEVEQVIITQFGRPVDTV
jgi:regulator of protease activity HflC (stomatin/prohibitin superfamily)